MSSEEIDTMLSNLSAIKSGHGPRQANEPQSVTSDSLALMKEEVDRLYGLHTDLRNHLDRRKLHCGVSRNDGRNGVCKYGKRLTKQRFNKQITQTERASGHVAIVVNEKILEDGNSEGFLDTVRHELAHALAWKMYEEYPSRKNYHYYDPYFKSHGKAWKGIATMLGADPSSSHNKRDRSDEYKYYLGCPACGATWGKTKRSKVIKRPFHRQCGCGESSLVSYDAGDDMPEENGTVAVESLSWDGYDGWVDAGRP